jgi:hypothetical protein
VQANVIAADGGTVSTTLSGSTEARRATPARVYLDYAVESFDGFTVEVAPVSSPPDAIIGALWTAQCGANFWSDPTDGGVSQTSVNAFCWNSDRDKATTVDAATSSCADDGDGMFCTRPYAWKLGASYRFELQTKRIVAAHIDYAFFITDVATGERAKLAELRYGGGNRPSSAYSYLRGYTAGSSCLSAGQVSARFGHVKKVDGDTVTDVKTASLSNDFDVGNDRICANYFFGATQDAFLLSTGGETVGPPLAPGDPAPTITLP